MYVIHYEKWLSSLYVRTYSGMAMTLAVFGWCILDCQCHYSVKHASIFWDQISGRPATHCVEPMSGTDIVCVTVTVQLSHGLYLPVREGLHRLWW